jgi:hypothetical protein
VKFRIHNRKLTIFWTQLRTHVLTHKAFHRFKVTKPCMHPLQYALLQFYYLIHQIQWSLAILGHTRWRVLFLYFSFGSSLYCIRISVKVRIKWIYPYIIGRLLHFILEQSYFSLTLTMNMESFKSFMKMLLIFSFVLLFTTWHSLLTTKQTSQIHPTYHKSLMINKLTFIVCCTYPMHCQRDYVVCKYEKLLNSVIAFSIGEIGIYLHLFIPAF